MGTFKRFAETNADDGSYDYINLITVLVGPGGAEKDFVVHKDIICAHSKSPLVQNAR